MDKNFIVTKSNYFIMNCSYDLSLEEQKLILTLASMVQPEDEDFKPYKFRIADFMVLLGVEDKSKYTEIPKMTKELMKKVFEIEEDDTILQTAWLSSATYRKGSGMVELEFSPRLKPYMLKLGGLFTRYKLANILSMKSKYSPRMYEILKCNEFKHSIEMEVDELRKLLKADNIYPLYNDFKRKVILQTQKELKKISDINFEFEEIKTGRKVTRLKFIIHTIKAKESSFAKAEIVADKEEKKTPLDDLQERITNTIVTLENKVTPSEALSICSSGDGNMELISKAYNYVKSRKKTENFVGYIIDTIERMKKGRFNEPKSTVKTGFNNFEPRHKSERYSYLEEQCLLGQATEEERTEFNKMRGEV